MTKTELRHHFRGKRSKLSFQDLEDKSLQIANRVLRLDIWSKNYFHLYLSITKHKEINTEYLLQILQGKDKHVIVSKSDFKSKSLMHFLLTDTTALQLNAYGIPEPAEGIEVPVEKLDVVFVPLLAFDKQGNRVGYGQGFYDRFLKQCRPDTIKVGLSFFEPVERIETDENDVGLDMAVTPDRIFNFR